MIIIHPVTLCESATREPERRPLHGSLSSGTKSQDAEARRGAMPDQERPAEERPPIWAVGGNSRGQLGLGFTSDFSSAPTRVAFQLVPHQRIIEVFGGYEHTFALASDGEVFAFGNGSKGQLGIGNTDSHNVPQTVNLLCEKRVIKMAAGLEHSLALTESGDMYSFGDNLSGQLGLGDNYTGKELTPQKVPPFSKARVTQMACGQDHTAVLTSAGELFCFGNNRYGALGIARHDDEGPPLLAEAPQLVSTLKGKQVVQIGCGLQHTVALTSTGQVYCWGNNSRGQLGTGDTHLRYTPALVCKPLSSAKCIHVACGGQHTLALTDKDDLYGFGSDRHGQLGLGQEGVIFPVPSRIVRLAGRRVEHAVGGAWHTVVRTDTGESYVMGCILPAAVHRTNAQPAAGGADGAFPAPEIADTSSRNFLRRTATLTGTTSAADPFALNFGGFRRLMLPRGAEACSKGHSLFYGHGLGAPPRALRKVVKSLGRLKEDVFRMLHRQKPDVIFTSNDSGETSTSPSGGYGYGYASGKNETVGAHLAVVRARCPTLYSHAAAEIAKSSTTGEAVNENQDATDARAEPWRVVSPPGIPIAALRLVILYLYQDAALFDQRKPDPKATDSSSSNNRTPTETRRQQQQRAWPLRSGVAAGGDSTAADRDGKFISMDALDGYEADDNGQAWQERGEGEGEVAAGFGSFGGGGGGDGRSGREAPYDGLALDRLMGVMAAARTLKLTRLQGLCEKRAEAFVDCRTVHKVLRRAAEGGFPYVKRRCLEFCLTHLPEVCAPENSAEVVGELATHPHVLADVLSLSAASENARIAAAREMPYAGPGKIPCIEALRSEAACVVPYESYQMDFLKLFETVVVASVPQDARVHRPTVSFGDPGTSKGNHGDAKGKKSEATPSNESQTAAVAHPIESEGNFRLRAGEGTPTVTVHKCILAARSGFFRALLEGSMGDSRKDELTLKFEPVVGMSALLEFLRFIYTGRSGIMDPLTALDVLFLTKGAHGSGGFFQVTGNDELRAYCTSTLLKGLSSANALPILVRAKALGDQDALSSAIEFLVNNFHDCMQPPLGNSPVDTGVSSDEVEEVPACLENDNSPAVDLLIALARRCTVSVKKEAIARSPASNNSR